MKKCTQCGQTLSDETKFCFKCGGANFEPVTDAGAQQPGYQQPAYQPPVQQPIYQPPVQPPVQSYYPQQPAYQQSTASRSETVSIGMNILFLILQYIPLVNLIFAIIAVAVSKKKSYRNLAIAWIILAAICLVLYVILIFTMPTFFSNFFSAFRSNYKY